MSRYIPSEKQLKSRVKLVEVPVKGTYIAAIDERRKTSRNYAIKVLVPVNFTKSDLKRQTPRILREHKDFPDFVSMRTFAQNGKAVPTKETTILADLYSPRELARFAKFRKDVVVDGKREKAVMGDKETGKPGDVSEYDPDTGLPPVINDGPEDGEE